MKNIYSLTLLLSLSSVIATAQINFHRLSIGLAGGLTNNHGDLNSPQPSKVIGGSGSFYFSPFLNADIELQKGTLSGYETYNSRHFQNDFYAVTLSGKIHLGQFLPALRRSHGRASLIRHSLQGIFAGAGGGIIQNRQTRIYRETDNSTASGLNSNKELFVPLSFGVDNSGFNSRIITGICYQANYVLGDHVDGYYGGNKNDFYSTLMLSLKYKFGPKGIHW